MINLIDSINTLDYTGNQIRFENRNGVVWGSLTDMAKLYNKKVSHWLKLGGTKQYIERLESIAGITAMTTGKGGEATKSGTWGINKVILKFASWCDVDFEIWVYDVIEKLVSTGKVELSDYQLLENQNFQLKQYIDVELTNTKNKLKANYECFKNASDGNPIIFVKTLREERDKALIEATNAQHNMYKHFQSELENWKRNYVKSLPSGADKLTVIKDVVSKANDSKLKSELSGMLW